MKTRLAAWAALFVLIGVVYLSNPDFFRKLMQLLAKGNVYAIAEYIRSFGIWAIFISFLLSTIMTFGLIMPFVILSAANGAVFGIGWGTVVSWAGEVVGALIAFVFYRLFLRDAIVKRLNHTRYWQYVDKLSTEHGFKTILLARILPVIPSGILTAVASLSNISFCDFFWATALGKIPSVFVKVLIGHDLIHFEAYKARLLMGAAVLLLLYLAAWWWKRKNTIENMEK